ncbi:carbonic anhydrase [Halobacillus litoralis]|uniref:carbonic anhydrase n=1 Tax=Halobacillus litoralis TaxID=45668 RepID=UPI001CFEED0E|nr:carbonic anhydrase [Halobacillus litoralis]
MSEKTFATAINCMDGRVQLPVIHWMQERYGTEYIDMITEAGPTKFLLEGSEDQLVSVQAKIKISADNHGSNVVAVVGHHNCAGNPVEREVKEGQIKESVDLVKSWGFNVDVIGLYVNENWEVEVVKE